MHATVNKPLWNIMVYLGAKVQFINDWYTDNRERADLRQVLLALKVFKQKKK